MLNCITKTAGVYASKNSKHKNRYAPYCNKVRYLSMGIYVGGVIRPEYSIVPVYRLKRASQSMNCFG